MFKAAIADYRYYNESPEPDDFYREIIAGFSQHPRSIPPKYFYDEAGFSSCAVWTDTDRLFSLHFLRVDRKPSK